MTAGRSPLLVLHEYGDERAAAGWQPLVDAWLARGGEPAFALAPDLPGHGAAPMAEGGKLVPSDLQLYAVRVLRDAGVAEPPVAVGHGWGGFAVELLAAAGRAAAVVLVDGLGGPWVSQEELGLLNAQWLRAVFDDPGADGPPAGGLDPLVRHGFVSVWEREFTEARRAAVTGPVLALETPRSPTPRAERDERLAAFGGEVECEEIDAPAAEAVAAALSRRSW